MLTQDKLQLLRADIDAALAEVAAKHGLSKLALGRITYGFSTFSAKLEGIEKGGLSPEAQAYESHRGIDKKLPPLNSEFTAAGRTWTVTGMTSRGKILAKEVSTGRQAKFRSNPFH